MHAKNYWNPYLAGLLLGLTLLATYLVAGQGLGASAFPKRVIAIAAHEAAPAWTARNPALQGYVEEGKNPLHNWLVIEVIGVLLGGFIGALSAGRLKRTIERGPHISARGRLLFAFAGGIIMGVGAGIARGCASGQALSGGGSLATGSWAFMMLFFGGAYATAYFVRRQWL